MIPPHNLPDETAVARPKYERAALHFSLVLAVIIIAALVISRALLNRSGASSILGPFFYPLIGGIALSARLIWRGKTVLGTSLFAAFLFGAVGYTISQRTDMGAFLAVDIAFLMAVLMSYAWPRRWLKLGIPIVIAVGILLLLADFYWPVARPASSGIVQPVLYAATGLILAYVAILLLNQFPDYTLRTKLTITFLAVTLVPLTVTALINNRATQNILIENANQTLFAAASQTAVNLDDFLRNGLSDIRTEANILGAVEFLNLTPEQRASPFGETEEPELLKLLKNYRDKNPIDIVSYVLLDTQGQVWFQYPPAAVSGNESDRLHFTAALESRRPTVTPVEFSPDDNEAYLHFSHVVTDENGEVVGVLRGRYKAAVLQTLITRSTGLVGGQSFAVLFDENHLHLAHGTAPDIVYKLTAMPAAAEIAALQASQRLPDLPPDELSTDLPELGDNLSNASSQPFFTATDIATGDRLNQVAVAHMDEQPWQVAFFQPQDVFLSPVETQTRRTVLLVLAITGAVAAIAVAVATIIARPIINLDAAAAQVAQGDLTVQAKIQSNDEIGALARTFNVMTAQLRDLIANLERRVANRTRALEISGEVSRRLSTILDQQELVREVVEQVQKAFDYYHAHIYLFDETGDNLVMVGGTGEAGQAMLERGHKIPKGKGLVGRAGETNSVVLAPDVAQEPGWLPNPLLPNTQAEIAVPISVGDKALGVLDVQQDWVHGLGEADADLLRSISHQVAVALENARLYRQTQQQAERQTAVNIIGQKILSANTVEDAMQTAVRELGRALNVQYSSVRLDSAQLIDRETDLA